jgi:hypothetical protein
VTARLKLDLLCLGARLPDAAFVTERGGRPLLRTRAGLGSGLELILPGDRGADELHVNVAVTEPFAQSSPYRIEPAPEGDRVRVLLEEREVALARLAPRPRWYDALTRSGKPMSRVATLQGTVLAVYPGRVCDFWVRSEHRAAPESCRFCSVGLNLGADDDPEKSADDVLEAAHAARRESGVTYVDLNAGHADDAGFLDRLLPLARRLKRETGLLVGVQTPPHADASRWAALREAGVNRVSFCFELFDPERFREVCPGKARVYGQRAFFDSIETCLTLTRRRRWLPSAVDLLLSPWVVNGEIIAGLEPPSRSIEAIDWLTARGAIPTVCCFRPLVGTALASEPPPSPDALLPVFRHLYRASLARRLPIGIAPGIHVSLVLLPDEAAGLVPEASLTAAERRWARALARRRRAFAWLRGPRARAPWSSTSRQRR